MKKLETVSEYTDFIINAEKAGYKYSHTSYYRGYVSRKLQGIVNPYTGKFGTGYTLDMPNKNSSQYSLRAYYVKEK